MYSVLDSRMHYPLLGKKKGVSALAARMGLAGLDPSKMMRGVGGPTGRPEKPEPTVSANFPSFINSHHY